MKRLVRCRRMWGWQVVALGLSLGQAHAQEARPPEPRGIVGVLLPTLNTGVEHMMDRVPAQYREMYKASMSRVVDLYGKEAPLAVQDTWVEMLERKGVRAVPMEAATAQAAVAEAQAKGVTWLLSSTAEAKGSATPGGSQAAMPSRGVRIAGNTVNVDLSVGYSLTDNHAHILIPLRQNTFSAVMDARGDAAQGDVWEEAGNAVTLAVVGALPLRTQQTPAPGILRPTLPEMTDSVRFDIAVHKRMLFNGKLMPGADTGQSTSILAFAGDAVTTQDRGKGVIYAPGSPRLFLVDDQARIYETLTAQDLMALRSMSEMGRVGKKAEAKLVRTGGEAKLVHYHVEREPEVQAPEQAQAMATAMANLPDRYRKRFEQTTSTEETTVDVEYGEPLPAWQHGVKALAGLFEKVSGWPIDLAENQQIANAIWVELAKSPAPPVRITVRDASGTAYKGKKNSDTVNEVVAEFATPKLARAVDFSIPSDYRWHTNPVLQGFTMMSVAQ